MLNRFSLFKRALSYLDSSKILKEHGIHKQNIPIYHNLSYRDIYKHEKFSNEKETTKGVVSVSTGVFTGRSPKDKYIVENEKSKNNVCEMLINQ